MDWAWIFFFFRTHMNFSKEELLDSSIPELQIYKGEWDAEQRQLNQQEANRRK